MTIVGGLHSSQFGMNIFRSWSQAAIPLRPAALLLSGSGSYSLAAIAKGAGFPYAESASDPDEPERR